MMLEHPEITRALRTGYPSWVREDYGEECDDEQDAWDAYCDHCYEERREKEFGL